MPPFNAPSLSIGSTPDQNHQRQALERGWHDLTDHQRLEYQARHEREMQQYQAARINYESAHAQSTQLAAADEQDDDDDDEVDDEDDVEMAVDDDEGVSFS